MTSATPTDAPTHQVSCHLQLRCLEPSTLALVVSVAAGAADSLEESLSISQDGTDLSALEVIDLHGTRTHVVRAEPGALSVIYHARLVAASPPQPAATPMDAGRLEALRQSRYSPSDALMGFARATFGAGEPDSAAAHRVADWTYHYLAYTSGSSGPLDSAVETLLYGRGVCRDFVHLTAALCRGLGIPSRLVAVYAPGLSPMDFHAVVEVHTEHGWEVIDPTRLAPRPSLVRIATGRDAADTAFVTTLRGDVAFDAAEVLAVVEGDLPADDHTDVVRVA